MIVKSSLLRQQKLIIGQMLNKPLRETTKESSFERKFKPEEVTQDTSSLLIEDNTSVQGSKSCCAIFVPNIFVHDIA